MLSITSTRLGIAARSIRGAEGEPDLKLRITWVNVHVHEDGAINRELLGLRL